MQTESLSLCHEFIKLIPILTGAILAILGGVATQYIVYRLNHKQERIKLYREKGESLVQSLYEFSDWLNEKSNKLVYSKEGHDLPSPLDKSWMIQKLYFPELSKPLLDIMTASKPMLEFIYTQRINQLANYDEWSKSFDNSPYLEHYKKYLRVFEVSIVNISDALKPYI